MPSGSARGSLDTIDHETAADGLGGLTSLLDG